MVLTSPAGFSPTPSGGPTQAQNAVLSFTGSLTANVQVTLPIPGSYIVENLTTGNFVLTFAAVGVGQVVAVDQGESVRLYNNGTNVRFVNLGRVGEIAIWAGLSAMPSWVAACTVSPYLLCDGTVYNFSTYPYLGKRLGLSFGGNGITTFGVPDLRGRMALPYDGTASRITMAGCGLNGQMIGAFIDAQAVALTGSQIPTITAQTPGVVTVNFGRQVPSAGSISGIPAPTSGSVPVPATSAGAPGDWSNLNSASTPAPVSTTSNNTGGASPAHANVQPSQVTGIAVIRAA